MKANFYFSCFFVILLTSCNFFIDADQKPDYNKRIVIKNISLDAKSEVEIYHYSLITGFSPCFIDLKTDKTHKLICESSYISDMRVAGDTLIISLWKNHYHKLDTVGMNGLKIVIDTSGHQPNW
ncbi:hypothetical protein [Chitinophaga filiformis]|uniref:Lipoprotein n=1 Tax=Chitinophaga filiformis TaxID=104663 RepID=A0ABY4HY41_CHIFI|nr:hypothetical protein [Chitinophaga filiformis]UPK67451.1 hypothetical protein MYF79_21135 [Chitinophaga filiformis]